MTASERAELIGQYREGYAQVAQALHDITPAELDYRWSPQKWTAREIIHHLADSEMTSAIRLRRLLVEEQPRIQAYDQEAFARRLFYARRAIAPALAAFKAARETTVQLLELMTEDDWQRTGQHSESGAYSAETWLRIYAPHAHNHAEQIRQCRARYQEQGRGSG
ncbi:MAG: DinB family protein [candidate division KSB1 bacterium]|nr:DinB family protein [candidate division KSB1 bacterium]MDZ7274811.1 DinB family protein [candidate division KSB1 bacterium]MDZ7285636.1 DinB family protein [candidate division KSB1 bacterium]MDZ7298668.1 DinB family protein [candidate division KSB1 bacterium]MDZ7308793.1 DinB family protein [candidate division KSB1 bacterium]